jgi:hypothetical protein
VPVPPEDADDVEEPDDPDDDDTSDDLVYCPECRAEIYALAERCPACGHLILHNERRQAVDKRPAPRGIKFGVAVVLALLAALTVVGLTLGVVAMLRH